MITVTYVSPFVPHARIPHAGGQFLFHYLSGLASLVEARLLAPATDENRDALNGVPSGVAVHLFPVPDPPTSPWGRGWHYLHTRSDGLTMGFGERAALASDETARAFTTGSDLVELHWSESLPLLPTLREWVPAARIVAVEHDVRWQALSSRARHAARRRERLLSSVAVRRVRRREPALLNQCAAVLVYTEKDERILRRLGVTGRIEKITPYLDSPPSPSGPGGEPAVLFVAAFDRLENVEGAIWFLQRVWPLVQERCPPAQLVVAGAKPPPELLAHAGPAVRITGYVEDLDPLYRDARVAVCPLISGAGIKFKVVQALLYALPVVTTSVGADGIVDRSGPDVFAAVTDDPAEFAIAVVTCLADRGHAVAVGQRGRAWAAGAYRFEASIEVVSALYRDLTDPLA